MPLTRARRCARLLCALGLAGALSACAPAAGGEAAMCDPVEQPPLQAGAHLIGEQQPPVAYSSTPPTSGWHSSGRFAIGVQPPDDPLSAPQQVSVLEAGGVVVSYRELPAERLDALESLVNREFAGVVAVTPFDQVEPGEVVLTAWGVLQRCDGVDADAITAFVRDHAAETVSTPGH